MNLKPPESRQSHSLDDKKIMPHSCLIREQEPLKADSEPSQTGNTTHQTTERKNQREHCELTLAKKEKKTKKLKRGKIKKINKTNDKNVHKPKERVENQTVHIHLRNV